MQLVRTLTEKVRDGAVYVYLIGQEETHDDGDKRVFTEAIRRAEFAGLAVLPGLIFIEQQLVTTSEFLERENRLLRVLAAKIALGLGMASCARWVLGVVPTELKVYDFVSQASASLIVAAEFYLVGKIFNGTWFWRNGLTRGGSVWQKEAFESPALLKEKTARKNLAGTYRLNNIEELLPFIELAGAGLPAMLNLLVPAIGRLT